MQKYDNINITIKQNKKGKPAFMEASHNGIEAVTLTEILGLDSWNQPRTSEDLQSFINRKHEELDVIDGEDEDLS